MKIIKKIPHKSGYEGWNITTEDGMEWSLLNFADSMKNHPFPQGLYLGWEAWNGEEVLRGTEKELINLIIKYPNI